MKTIRRFGNRKGMTVAEVIIAAVILGMILFVLVAVFNASARQFMRSQAEAELFAEGSYVMDRMQRGEGGLFGIMKARQMSIAVSEDQRTITFAVDKNSDYTVGTGDDIDMSMYFENGDGDDATLEDNVAVIDPNTTVVGDEIEIGRNIENLIFTDGGNVVTIDLTIRRSVRGMPVRMDFARDIFVRN